MKILHIIGSLAGGGAERLVTQLAIIMSDYEHTCDVLALTDTNAVYLNHLRENNVFVQISPYKNRFDIRILLLIKKIITQGQYCIVHSHTFPATYWTSLAAHCFKNKIKFIMTEHNTFNRRRSFPWLRMLEKYIYRKYDIVISISEEVRQALLNWVTPKETQKYLTIVNGIDIKSFKEAISLTRDELGVPAEAFLIGMVGSLTAQKNHKALIHAIAILPKNVHAIIAGEGPLLRKTIALSEDLGIDERVHFLGFRCDIERVIKAVDIVVIPSLWEGFGLVAVEAMACGKPIAASNVTGLREVIGDSGILFAPDDYNDIARSILSIMSDKELFSSYAKKAQIRAEKFGIKKMVLEYMCVYSRIVGESE